LMPVTCAERRAGGRLQGKIFTFDPSDASDQSDKVGL
jgi:hypothetical protein